MRRARGVRPDGEEDALARSLPDWQPFPEVPARARARARRAAGGSRSSRTPTAICIDASIGRIGVPFDAVDRRGGDRLVQAGAKGTGARSSADGGRLPGTSTSRRASSTTSRRRTSSACRASGSTASARRADPPPTRELPDLSRPAGDARRARPRLTASRSRGAAADDAGRRRRADPRGRAGRAEHRAPRSRELVARPGARARTPGSLRRDATGALAASATSRRRADAASSTATSAPTSAAAARRRSRRAGRGRAPASSASRGPERGHSPRTRARGRCSSERGYRLVRTLLRDGDRASATTCRRPSGRRASSCARSPPATSARCTRSTSEAFAERAGASSRRPFDAWWAQSRSADVDPALLRRAATGTRSRRSRCDRSLRLRAGSTCSACGGRWRRRGLGRALLLHSFRELAALDGDARRRSASTRRTRPARRGSTSAPACASRRQRDALREGARP